MSASSSVTSSTSVNNTNPMMEDEGWGSYLHDLYAFSLQYLHSPRAVGTPFPCSSFVAKEIVKYIPPASQNSEVPRRILEIGPGLGAFTGHIISKMGPNDHLDLVEIEKPFCDILNARYGHDKRVHVEHESITEWHPELKYDYIVTAVPLNALDFASLVKPILESYVALLKEHGILSAIEYVGTSTLKRGLMCGEEQKSEFDKVQQLKTGFFDRYSFEKTVVVRNMPPARVFHCRKN